MVTTKITRKDGKVCVTYCADEYIPRKLGNVTQRCLRRYPVDGGVVAVLESAR